MRPRLEMLEPKLVDRVLGEAFELLMTPGVKVQSSEARDLLAQAGATIDGEIAHIPESLARQQLSTVPHEFWLHDRAGSSAVHYGDDDVHFDPGSSGGQILDADTLAQKRWRCCRNMPRNRRRWCVTMCPNRSAISIGCFWFCGIPTNRSSPARSTNTPRR
jgi:trimethylamine:corrinoid methyltransferase-like protein